MRIWKRNCWRYWNNHLIGNFFEHYRKVPDYPVRNKKITPLRGQAHAAGASAPLSVTPHTPPLPIRYTRYPEKPTQTTNTARKKYQPVSREHRYSPPLAASICPHCHGAMTRRFRSPMIDTMNIIQLEYRIRFAVKSPASYFCIENRLLLSSPGRTLYDSHAGNFLQLQTHGVFVRPRPTTAGAKASLSVKSPDVSHRAPGKAHAVG